jgi:DNA-binding YbaB/EbfC family protein
MFGKAKEQFEFIKKAREIQKKLKDMTVESESGAVKIVMNGEQKVQAVNIDKDAVDVDRLDKLEKEVQSAIEGAISKSQKVAAEVMKDMGGLGLPGL